MAELDYGAIGVFVRCGMFLGDTTPWSGVPATPPEGMPTDARRTLWDYPGDQVEAATAARPELIEQYVDLFRDAIGRMLPDRPYVMPLSGGRDSHHILLELCRRDHAPESVITVRKHSKHDPEVDAARALSRHLGIDHLIIDSVGLDPVNERRQHELTRFESEEHGWMMPLADQLTNVTTLTYDGIAGDVLSAGLFLTPERMSMKSDPEQFADHLLGEEMPIAKTMTPDFYEQIPRQSALDAVATAFSECLSEANPVGAFFLRHRTRRKISHAPYSLYRGVEVRAPYLDTDLVRFLRSIPDAVLVDHAFHTETIHAAFPAAASVPFAGRPNRRRSAKSALVSKARVAALSRHIDSDFVSMSIQERLTGGPAGVSARMLLWLASLEAAHRCGAVPHVA